MVTDCYFELRKSNRGGANLTADVMRHLHTRQHLGKAVVVCDQPANFISTARKHWLKLSRTLQKERSSTLNADKILKYTHAVTRMQRMHFTTKRPLERPEADIYFLAPEDLEVMPLNCWTVYMLCPARPETAAGAFRQLPGDSLVVDYCQSEGWKDMGLRPKKQLEAKLKIRWKEIQGFLKQHRIDVTKLVSHGIHDVEAIDDALDTLLGGHASEFMQKANEFQRSLELARPVRLSQSNRAAYDSLILLAHRVQALTPEKFRKHFLEVYNEDDTFFLYDIGRHLLPRDGESLTEAFARHTQAGRHHLARSLQSLSKQSA